jgi:hypothetical protein
MEYFTTECDDESSGYFGGSSRRMPIRASVAKEKNELPFRSTLRLAHLRKASRLERVFHKLLVQFPLVI